MVEGGQGLGLAGEARDAIRVCPPCGRPTGRPLRTNDRAPACFYNGRVEVTTDDLGPVAPLTPEQQAWVRHSEALWRRAQAVADSHPGLDPGDVYHALRCLELSPEARLRRGLSRGRLRAHAR